MGISDMSARLGRVAAVGAAALAFAQPADSFVALDAIPSPADADDVLFFELDDSFAACVPLELACPQESSTLMVVPVAGKRLVWVPEAADLNELDLGDQSVAPIGAAPADAASAQFLVPVLEGEGIFLVHAPRRLNDGELVAPDADGGVGTSGSARLTPVLAGPLLSTATPSRQVPERILDAPRVVPAARLEDATPAVLARRAAPTRVVFGVRSDPAWKLGVDYVPLLTRSSLPVLARYDETVGLAVTLPAGVSARVSGADPPTGPRADRDDSSGIGPVVVAVAAAAAAIATTAVGLRRRSRRRRQTG